MLPVKIKHTSFSFIFTIFIIVFLGINISNVYAVTFIDHSGFIPNWASNIGQSQTLSICSTSIQSGTNDFKWCSEFSGYILDQLSSKTSVTFKDHTGYIPPWVSAMGPSQTLSVCSTSIEPYTQDFKWCSEFSGYTLDQLSATGNTSQQSAIPEFGSTYGIIIMLSMIIIITISRKFPI